VAILACDRFPAPPSRIRHWTLSIGLGIILTGHDLECREPVNASRACLNSVNKLTANMLIQKLKDSTNSPAPSVFGRHKHVAEVSDCGYSYGQRNITVLKISSKLNKMFL